MIQGITLPEAYDQNKYFNGSIFIYAVFQAGEMFEGEFQSLGNAWDVLGFSKKRALWLFDIVLRYSYGIVMVYRCI